MVGAYVTWKITGAVKPNTYIAIVPKPASGPVKWVNDDGHGNNPVYMYVGTHNEGTYGISIPCYDRNTKQAYGGQYVAFAAENDSWEASEGAVSPDFTVAVYGA